MKEKDVENAILALLHHLGVTAWKNETGGTWDPKKKVFRKKQNKYHITGVADILGYLSDGTFLALEVKKPETRDAKGKIVTRKGYATPEQKRFIEEAVDAGCCAAIVRSVDEVLAILHEWGEVTLPEMNLRMQ